MRDLYHDPKHQYRALGYLEKTLSEDDFYVLVETENDIESLLNHCDESNLDGTNLIEEDYTKEELIEFVKQLRLQGI